MAYTSLSRTRLGWGCHVQQALSERIDVLGGALNLLLTCCLGMACTKEGGLGASGWLWWWWCCGTCAVANTAEILDNARIVEAGQLAASFSWPDLPQSIFACAGAAKSRHLASEPPETTRNHPFSPNPSPFLRLPLLHLQLRVRVCVCVCFAPKCKFNL